MTVQTLTALDFEAAWQAAPEHRYGYELNNGILALFGGLLGGFWVYWTITASQTGMDWVLSILAVVFVIISLYVLFNIVRWRHFGRTSGAVCEADRLVWRQGSDILAAYWNDLSLDSIGLLDVSMNERKHEHYLNINGHLLYLFRPFVRMRGYEGFVADILIRLKAHDRIRESKGKRKKRKR